MRAQGIIPATKNWSRRSRNWILGHGSSYNEEIGELVHNNEKIIVAHKDLVEAIEEVRAGKFHPDREKDELSKALKNKEHTGRTRGLGPNFPWKIGFPEDVDTYRSRSRSKKHQADRLENLENIVNQLQQQMSQQGGTTVQLQAGTAASSDPSQRKSSVASMPVDEAPMDRYPVDDLGEKRNCQLHQSMKNISMKVAEGFALACEPRARWHGGEIQAGYARVGVDEVLPRY